MKKILFIILGLVGLLIAVALIAPAFISSDVYKAEIKKEFEEATGHTLTIDGDLRISLFPFAGFMAEKVTISNPPGFDDKTPFLTLRQLKMDVEIWPLLTKKTVVMRFVMHEPSIHMRVSMDGKNNWMPAGKPKKPQSPPAPAPNKPGDAEKRALPDNVMFSNFELKGGTLTYVNDVKSTRMEVRKLDASMVLSSSASAVIIESSGEWNNKNIRMTAGLGTLESFLKEQKMDYKLNVESDLFSVSAEGNYNHGAIVGKSTIKAASLKDVAAWLAPQEKPLATPAKLAFLSESDIRCGTSYCNFANIRFLLDKLEANGSIRINAGQAVPSLDIDLKTDMLDLNPFLPAAEHVGLMGNPLIADAFAQGADRWSSTPIDLSWLKSFNANASIKTGGILYRKITIGKTALNAKLQQGRFTATIPDAEMYSGTGTIALTVDSNTAPPTFEKRALFKSIQVEPLLKDASDMGRLTGTADIQVNTSGRGNSQKDIISSLTGDGQIKLSNGTIKRVNLLDMLKNVQAAFTDANSESQTTGFTQMSGSFSISQGVATNRDLLMQLQGMNVNGEGTVNLPAYAMNYRLTPKIIRTTQDQATGAAVAKGGISVPVIIEGSLDQPTFRPDLAAVVTEALKDPAKLREELKNSRGALKDQLKDPKAAVKNLKGLLKGF